MGISKFITNVADLLRHASSNDPSQDGLIMGYIDDLYWAAPFEKMVQVIAFVQDNGPKYGYKLNLKKSIYLMSTSPNATTFEQLEERVQTLNSLGIPTSNVTIHPSCQRQTSSQVEQFRRLNWGFKALGAFVGTDDA